LGGRDSDGFDRCACHRGGLSKLYRLYVLRRLRHGTRGMILDKENAIRALFRAKGGAFQKFVERFGRRIIPLDGAVGAAFDKLLREHHLAVGFNTEGPERRAEWLRW